MMFSRRGVFDFFRIRRARNYTDRRRARDCWAWRIKQQRLQSVAMPIQALLVDPGAHVHQKPQPGPHASRGGDCELANHLQPSDGQDGGLYYRINQPHYLPGNSFPSNKQIYTRNAWITPFESVGIGSPQGLSANRLARWTIPLLADTRRAQAFRLSLIMSSATAICAGVATYSSVSLLKPRGEISI